MSPKVSGKLFRTKGVLFILKENNTLTSAHRTTAREKEIATSVQIATHFFKTSNFYNTSTPHISSAMPLSAVHEKNEFEFSTACAGADSICLVTIALRRREWCIV